MELFAGLFNVSSNSCGVFSSMSPPANVVNGTVVASIIMASDSAIDRYFMAPIQKTDYIYFSHKSDK
jgi:hypothetical protein